MKKNIFLTILLVVFIGFILTLYSKTNPKINSTGAIPAEDVEEYELLSQLVRLVDMSPIETNQYKITTENYGVVNLEIYPPFEENKKAALKWLRDNGFDKIVPATTTYNTK